MIPPEDATPLLPAVDIEGGTFRLRHAARADLPVMVRLLADDAMGELEGVRVAASLRGQGIGKLMVGWAMGESRRRGCTLMQLTTHQSRAAAHRFYEQLGFEASHVGMKLML